MITHKYKLDHRTQTPTTTQWFYNLDWFAAHNLLDFFGECRKGLPMKSNPSAEADKKALSKPTTYTVDGRNFIVEPVFKDEAYETLGEILLKLILDKENYQQN